MIPNSKFYDGPGLEAVVAIKKGAFVTAYGGKKWRVQDPNIPEDSTYQIVLPTDSAFILDAEGHMEPPYGKWHKINECWDPEEATIRFVGHGNIFDIVFRI